MHIEDRNRTIRRIILKKDYATLRQTYETFQYHTYTYERKETSIVVTYDFEIIGLDHFHPTWEFPYSVSMEKEALEELLFSLGMVELISYWKLTCAPRVEVLCGQLTLEQIAWWKKLYYHGLGEFYYLNGIMDESVETFMELSCIAKVDFIDPILVPPTQTGYLVPIGGGKDSVVTLDLLHSMGKEITTYSVNRIDAVAKVVEIDTKKKADILAKRTLDGKMITYNREGYLNGHTPFSAIVAFSSVITALVNGIEFIALSNESSANESTVKDSHVNHQYSKSVEFENDFRTYISWILDTKISYFSALRPLLEVQIASLFAKSKAYHGVFRSCNAGSKTGVWCGVCPKCLFVYMILAPFLPEDELIDIFGKNLLDQEGLEVYFKELTGISENKPFECVGTRAEVVSALVAYLEKQNREPEYLLAKYKTYFDTQKNDLPILLQQWYPEHNVPEEIVTALRSALAIEDTRTFE